MTEFKLYVAYDKEFYKMSGAGWGIYLEGSQDALDYEKTKEKAKKRMKEIKKDLEKNGL